MNLVGESQLFLCLQNVHMCSICHKCSREHQSRFSPAQTLNSRRWHPDPLGRALWISGTMFHNRSSSQKLLGHIRTCRILYGGPIHNLYILETACEVLKLEFFCCVLHIVVVSNNRPGNNEQVRFESYLSREREIRLG